MKYSVLLVLLLLVSCSSQSGLNSDISINKYQSKNKFGIPYLIIKCYDFDFENKRSAIPALVTANDIVFEPKIENDSIKATVIRPSRDSKIDIEIIYIGKKTIVLNNYKIAPKDSVIFNVHMTDSNEVLY